MLAKCLSRLNTFWSAITQNRCRRPATDVNQDQRHFTSASLKATLRAVAKSLLGEQRERTCTASCWCKWTGACPRTTEQREQSVKQETICSQMFWTFHKLDKSRKRDSGYRICNFWSEELRHVKRNTALKLRIQYKTRNALTSWETRVVILQGIG